MVVHKKKDVKMISSIMALCIVPELNLLNNFAGMFNFKILM